MLVGIEPEAMYRIKGFTELAPGEVAGIARVKLKGESLLYVYDLKLFPGQMVTAGSVNIGLDEFGIFLSSQNNPEEFKFLWHSHGNMEVFLSSIDESYISAVLTTSPYLLSCVSNKKGKLLLRFDGVIDGIRIKQPADLDDGAVDYTDLKDELDKHIIVPEITYNGREPSVIGKSVNSMTINEMLIEKSFNHPWGCDCMGCTLRRSSPDNLSLLDNIEKLGVL